MKLVAIGGGTGLSTLLKGLKEKVGRDVEDLSAIVTVADSGGSTGKLRRIYNVPAPGDIRNCIVALSESEDILRELFQFRFKGGELDGHAFGNLLLVALAEITGSFMQAINIALHILRTKGEIIPATLESIQLCARFSDGKLVCGEEEITEHGKSDRVRIEKIWIEPEGVKAPIDAVAKIESADMIVFGPGSLYTSIIPNLLIEDIRDAVLRSQGVRVFVVNAMTQPGETEGYTAYDHIRAFKDYTGIDRIDVAVINTRMPSDRVLRRYLEQRQEPVIPDIARIAKEGIEVYTQDLIGEKEDFVRHDPYRLADLIVDIYRKHGVFP